MDDATSVAPPRDMQTRIADTLEHLHDDVDAWVATAGSDGPWVVPLSFAWDGRRLLFATATDSRTIKGQPPPYGCSLGTSRPGARRMS